MKESDFVRVKDRVLNIIKSNSGVVTTAEIASELKVSWNTAEKYLLEMALDNQVIRIKKAGVNLWVRK
ncbi:MAG TPA: hypothetical protein HA224_03350 [Nanoarchaeota archaeon]|nr:hypothetical protein [Nanoarchaeota archaeon]